MAASMQEIHATAVRPRSYQDDSYRQGFFDTIGDLQNAGVLQDVVLEVESRQFPCHRLVLSAASPYLRAMFTSDMAESRQKTVVLQGINADAFQAILSYIYSGTLHVSLDKVQPLYQAADLLQLDYVRNACRIYMVMNVDRSTCVDMYRFADFFSMVAVRNRSLQCICRFFSEVSHTKEFYSLSVKQLTEMISHDKLDVKVETTVWEAVVRWVQHSREDRLHHLPSILPHIRFNLLTSDDTAAISEHPLVNEDPGSSELRNLEQRSRTSNLKRRIGMDAEEMVLQFRTVETSPDTIEMLCVNPRSGKYIRYSYNLPEVRSATVTSNNDIYILVLESYSQLSLLQYNHVENLWEQMSSMHRTITEQPCEMIFEDLVEVNGYLYYLAFSWARTKGVSMVMKKYQWFTNLWQDCSKPDHDGLASGVALSCGKHLYLFSNTEIHRYDPSQDVWCKRTPLRTIPNLFSAVAIGTEIFCTDMTFRRTVVYDVEADSWREIPGFPEQNQTISKGFPILCAHEGQLHAMIDLYNDDDTSHTHAYVYDRSVGVWSDLQVTLPGTDRKLCERVFHVARMYTCLPGQNDQMDTQDEDPQDSRN
ncbi:kelch repeat and BTB domain-containing protein 8-like [Branchiostoma floridae x Branchiostoma japonicum]